MSLLLAVMKDHLPAFTASYELIASQRPCWDVFNIYIYISVRDQLASSKVLGFIICTHLDTWARWVPSWCYHGNHPSRLPLVWVSSEFNHCLDTNSANAVWMTVELWHTWDSVYNHPHMSDGFAAACNVNSCHKWPHVTSMEETLELWDLCSQLKNL